MSHSGCGLFEQIDSRKPARALVDLILNHHQVAPDQCLFVGDSGTDLHTARALNMPFLYVSYGYDARDNVRQDVTRCPDFDTVVSHLFELQIAGAW